MLSDGEAGVNTADGKAASAMGEGLEEVWCSVTNGRVAKVPGGEAVGKWRVMWGLEVSVPGREAVVRRFVASLKNISNLSYF